MLDKHYLHPRLAKLYDFDSPWSIDRDFYLALAGKSPQQILDLGCGTGLLCEVFAKYGHRVTGVDPAPAMVDIARQRPFGSQVEWVCRDAQTFRSKRLFDLIIMTGHAFQTLLTASDILATFETLRRQIKPDGLITFESRNPTYHWQEVWNYELEIVTPDETVRETRRFLRFEGMFMDFVLTYQFTDETLHSPSRLRFSPYSEILQYLRKSGLKVQQLLGDWDSALFDPQNSAEMIFLVKANPN